MPIDIEPTDVTTTVTTEVVLTCNKVHIVDLQADGSKLDVNPPTGSMAVLPYYQEGDDGPKVYAAADHAVSMSTVDIYEAAKNVPELGTLMLAAFALGKAWWAYRNERLAEAETAQAGYQKALDALQALPEDDPGRTNAQAAVNVAMKRATVARLAALDPANPRLT